MLCEQRQKRAQEDTFSAARRRHNCVRHVGRRSFLLLHRHSFCQPLLCFAFQLGWNHIPLGGEPSGQVHTETSRLWRKALHKNGVVPIVLAVFLQKQHCVKNRADKQKGAGTVPTCKPACDGWAGFVCVLCIQILVSSFK